ncbi:MAG TPA: hypothetical protein PLI95_14020 [Polyangiaceae bacterium]|nr:hypothetical protein [Polyangiaceae bacterium]
MTSTSVVGSKAIGALPAAATMRSSSSLETGSGRKQRTERRASNRDINASKSGSERERGWNRSWGMEGMERAAVGQIATHWPQAMQCASRDSTVRALPSWTSRTRFPQMSTQAPSPRHLDSSSS